MRKLLYLALLILTGLYWSFLVHTGPYWYYNLSDRAKLDIDVKIREH